MSFCGARTHRGTICTKPSIKPGGRCRWHGGLSTGPRNPHGFTEGSWAGWRRMIARYKALGMPMPWGRRKKRENIDRMAEDAVKQGELVLQAIDALPMVEAEGHAEEAGEALLVGMRAGLAAGVDICQAYLEARRKNPEAPIDMKLANLASMTGGWMCRIGVRVMEEGFRRKREDHIGRLLEALKIEDAKKRG